MNAAFRHLFEMLEGKDTDKDSGLPHSAHVMACMAILRDAQHMDTLDDDRLGKQTPLGRSEEGVTIPAGGVWETTATTHDLRGGEHGEKVVGVAPNPMTAATFREKYSAPNAQDKDLYL